MLSLAPIVLLTALLTRQAPSAPPLAFELETLFDRQVLQRDARGLADAILEGSCADGPAKLAVRVLRGKERVGGCALELKDLPGPRQRLHGALQLPAGGWYTLEIAEGEGGPALFTLAHLGVGEVFVVAGQSNSTNFGQERLPSLDDRVSAFDGTKWSLAQDPMPGVQDGSGGGSPWPRFGQLMVQALDLPVAIASVGYGGTSIKHWQKAHILGRDQRQVVLYDGLKQRLEALGRARAVLWHQGESDAAGSMTQAEYVQLFTQMQKDLGAELELPMPRWIVARVSYVPELAREKMDAIRAAQLEIWTKGLAEPGPDTDDLVGDMRHSQDHIHFSKRGLEAHAARWFALVFAYIAKLG